MWLAQENMLDYLFAKLAINAERIDHPILMTETLGNPLQSRSRQWFNFVAVYAPGRTAD